MSARGFLLDVALALGLPLALGIVFAVDGRTPPHRELAMADGRETPGSILEPEQRPSPKTETVESGQPEAKQGPAIPQQPAAQPEPPAQQPSVQTVPSAQQPSVQTGDPAPPQPQQPTQDRPQSGTQNPPAKQEDPAPSYAPSKFSGRKPQADSIYAQRAADNRIEYAKKRGGSPISEKAVDDGLNWLSRHQGQDGSWSDKCVSHGPGGRCERNGPCSWPGGPFAIAHTGLALLAFQGGGHFWFNETPYSAQVRRGLDWLVSQQTRDGRFENQARNSPLLGAIPWPTDGVYMYEHAIATFALAEACALAKHSQQQPDAKYQDALENAIKFIESTQDPAGGGWRYSPKEAGDASVTGWVVLAIKSAQAADVKVLPAVLDKCASFFRSVEMRANGRTGYMDRNQAHTEATTGVGMLAHHFLTKTPESDLVKAASAYLADYAEETWGPGKHKGGDIDFPRIREKGRADFVQPLEGQFDRYYIWYNCTLGMFLTGGENWERWNDVVRDAVLRLQQNQGCERGSWPPYNTIDKVGGRIYTTALSILTLEVYYRFAKKPMTAEEEKEIAERRERRRLAVIQKEQERLALLEAERKERERREAEEKKRKYEQAAAGKLAQVKDLIAKGNPSKAEPILKALIEQYPDAAVIPEARQILEGLPDAFKEEKEQLAAGSLKLVKRLLAEGKTNDAINFLNKLIANYPNTKAAIEARRILDEQMKKK